MNPLEIQIDTSSKAGISHQIYRQIKEIIVSGRLECGEKLPSIRKLALSVGVHYQTIRGVYQILLSEGLISSREKSGYFSSFKNLKETHNTKSNVLDPKPRVSSLKLPPLKSLADIKPKNPMPYVFSSGVPDLSLLPRKALAKCYREVFTTHTTSAFDYGDPQGNPRLRTLLKQYIKSVRDVNDKDVFITHGSGDGLFLLSQVLMQKPLNIAVEELTYPPALQLFRNLKANIFPVRMNKSGFDLDHFEKILKKRKIDFLFVTPVHQFPTTTNMSYETKRKIYQLACEYDFHIIEDDYDHEYHFFQAPSPIAALDKHERVLYINTFSKVLFPGVRIGLLAVPHHLIPHLINQRRLSSHQNDGITQEAIRRFIEYGFLDSHVRKTWKVYKNRLETLSTKLIQSNSMEFIKPLGGLSLWLDTKKNSDKIAAKAQENGIFVLSESIYQVNPSIPTHLRLGFSNLKSSDIEAATERLIKVIEQT